jgi:hypothetical protein
MVSAPTWQLICSRDRSHKKFTKVVHVPHLFLCDENGHFSDDLDVTDGVCIVRDQDNVSRCYECGAEAKVVLEPNRENPERLHCNGVSMVR